MTHYITASVITRFPKYKEKTYSFLIEADTDTSARGIASGYLVTRRLVYYEDELSLVSANTDYYKDEIAELEKSGKIIRL